MAEISAGSFAPPQSAVTPPVTPVTPVTPRGLDPSAQNERALRQPEESEAANNDRAAETRRQAEEADEEAGQREEDEANERQEQARNGSRVDVTV